MNASVRLRRLSGAEAAFAAWFGRGRLLSLQHPLERLALRPAQWDPAAPAPAVSLQLQTGAGPIALARGEDCLRLLAGIDVGQPGEAPAGALDWLLALAAARLPEPLRDGLGVRGAAWSTALPADPVWLSLSLYAVDGGRHDFALAAAAATWQALLARPGWQPLGPGPALAGGALPLLFRCTVGAARLPLARCRQLRRGDAVLLRPAHFDLDGEGWIKAGGRTLRVRALTTGAVAALEFLGWEDAMDEAVIEAVDAAGEMEAALPRGAAAEAAAGGFGQVPLLLEFDLGRLTLTLAELDALAPGAVLRLDAAASPPWVSIRANGQPVGRGELIEVDGRLAVQIDTLANLIDTLPLGAGEPA
ncbi:type III secretion system cytoplasmic ring protein SctQ [Chitinimonas koreensis]|uniref:type III secretion system cytoplasmic ring protein SctQ n=1 Tax=Chitinimonas koreensis TaxID=356302 RepID=UPI0004160B5F|nr:type III secretion system cytoplasmic ring protein SctQ [Chitinimonas koreensis]QNM97644.1 type III secretion system cytoplasmic ring protein SctQ [Chitinimonas koreensis]